jgi:hypothetical protein
MRRLSESRSSEDKIKENAVFLLALWDLGGSAERLRHARDGGSPVEKKKQRIRRRRCPTELKDGCTTHIQVPGPCSPTLAVVMHD